MILSVLLDLGRLLSYSKL